MDRAQFALYFSRMEPIPTEMAPSKKTNFQTKSILFDIYGTLFISDSGDIGTLQSKTDRSDALNQLINQFQLNVSADELLQSLVNNIQEDHLSKKSLGIDFPEIDILEIWRQTIGNSEPFNQAELKEFAVRFELIINPVYPMPGIKRVLKTCQQKGIKMGIISNAQFFTPFLFNWYLGKSPQELGFDDSLVFYSYQLGIAKPSLEMFKKASEQLHQMGIDPSHTVYLGNDMLKDVYPAKQVGFKTALFAGDERSLRLRENDPKCQAIKPDLIITELHQIESWL